MNKVEGMVMKERNHFRTSAMVKREENGARPNAVVDGT